MHFFSRYSYIWRFPEEKEKAYADFVLSANRAYLRLVSFITIFGMSLFLVIDFFKDVNFSVLLASRSVAMVVASVSMIASFKKQLSVRIIFAFIALILVTNLGNGIITALYANMPPYYLTNLLFLILVLVVTASGLNFRHALYLNTACMAIFLYFSQVIHRDPFYFSQYPHLFSILVYILIVGAVLENRRRLSFLNYRELEEQKKVIENLNQQKSKIISILSHDIAAPLNSLSGLINLQVRGLVSPDQVGPYVKQVSDRLDNVNILLQSLMRWSKSQIEGFVPERKALLVFETLTKTCHQFASQENEKSISLKVLGNEKAQAFVDKDMTMLVFRNLISNAIKFSKPNAPIEINVSQLTASILISFTNEGDPIPMDQREKLFSYNVQSTSGTAGEPGTGLGLALSAYFVKLNDGRIYLDDELTGRTTFCVELPAI